MLCVVGMLLVGAGAAPVRPAAQHEVRYLYVALPGPDVTARGADEDRAVRILVFDIADGHRFVRRIPVWPAGRNDVPEVVEYLRVLREIGYIGAGKQNVVAFEVKPTPNESSAIVIASAKRTLIEAWARL